VLKIEEAPDGRTVVLAGEIDMSNVEELVEAVTSRLGGGRVRLHMEGVTFIDSTGIRGLLRIAEASGGELEVVSPHTSVRKVLRVLGLDATPPLRVVDERGSRQRTP
jgi:anti-sigma B factor antagonist